MTEDGRSRTIDLLFETLSRADDRDYGTDRVTQLAHALQCAHQAEQAGATSAMVAAALLHDIGHLINADDRAAFRRGEDARHEVLGARYLEQWFGPEVTEPVALHVEAKRYLTASDPDYFDGLSSKSQQTLALQGGPFDAEEALEFRARLFADDALDLRCWDDGGKVVDASPPGLESFRACIEAVLK